MLIKIFFTYYLHVDLSLSLITLINNKDEDDSLHVNNINNDNYSFQKFRQTFSLIKKCTHYVYLHLYLK